MVNCPRMEYKNFSNAGFIVFGVNQGGILPLSSLIQMWDFVEVRCYSVLCFIKQDTFVYYIKTHYIRATFFGPNAFIS
jgi:hypothetical protein